MGSGSLAAMSVFESQWQKGLSQDDAVKLCGEAILAGIFNDLGSGSNVDVCIITPEKVPNHSQNIQLFPLVDSS